MRRGAAANCSILAVPVVEDGTVKLSAKRKEIFRTTKEEKKCWYVLKNYANQRPSALNISMH